MERQEKIKSKPEDKAGYEAPKVVRVSLRPEEAVLGHCKVNGSAGPVGGSCSSGASLLRCKSFGS
jgi:hypothetical protein